MDIMIPSEKMSFIQSAIYIFFVFNSIGEIPVFVSLLARYSHKKQIKIIIRELLIALVVLLAFAFFGKNMLQALQISTSTIGIGGGLLLIIIALNMIFPKLEHANKKDLHGHEPFIIPLAIPGLAGPATIAAMFILSAQVGPIVTAGALVIAWIPSLILLLAASFIKRVLGDKGILAVEKIGGMIIILLGIEMFTKGVIEVVKANFFS
ncbi:MAG: hypothetical protein KR126chlam4_00089 [Candidatus Anoxychlamydiales bacterium]|uniref:Uncharacterized protein n=1 Tax=marine sediment metagenome TaxID=412755 RepID=A0A0F9IFW2_9ZZZZ|nr:hypothetical protein [Candidatus Anoxychlamydiales bacterium]NGX40272.1 hypothetical protein [Candidatus Anoxychlamydiales bacterium]HEU64795.1 NAAT family transporter [Chlamydiota bacterium]